MFRFDCNLNEYGIQNLGWELKIQNITDSIKNTKCKLYTKDKRQ